MQQILCPMNGFLTSFGHGVSNFASSEKTKWECFQTSNADNVYLAELET